MSWVAVAIGGSAIVGGVVSNNASKRQAKAARGSGQDTWRQYAQTREDLMPWQQAGRLGLNELQQRMGLGGDQGTGNYGQLMHQFGQQDFQESPAYQFNLQEGKKALDKASASRRKFYAPSTLQDISKFSQGLASNEYQNAFSNYNTNMGNIWQRLYGMSGMGQSAANQTGAFGAAAAGNAGNANMQAANAQAAGQVGMANALNSGVSNYMNYNMLQQMLAGNQQSSVGGMGPNMGPQQG